MFQFIEKCCTFLMILNFQAFVLASSNVMNNQTHLKIKRPYSFECLIHNQEYGYEFLYHSNDTTSKLKSNVYTYPMEHVAKLDRIRWHIVPKSVSLNSKNEPIIETVYLKTQDSNKYLCASNRHVDRFKQRRRIYIMNKQDDKSCEWILENMKSDYTNTKYDNENNNNKSKDSDKILIVTRITNLKYKEALYAASNFFKKDRYNRNIYSWHEKNLTSKSKQFNWIIDCIDIEIKSK